MKRLSIIVPCFNEERTIAQVVDRLSAMPEPGVPREVIVVDDGSTDGTWAALQAAVSGRSGFFALRHERNQGKGSAIRSALAAASGDVVLIQDADLEYDPAEIPGLVEEFRRGPGSVFGSRTLRKNEYASSAFRGAGRFFSWFANALYGTRHSDVITCYKMVATADLLKMDLRSQRFEFDVEVPAKLARMGIAVREMPIGYRGRTRAEGKKIRLSDGAHLTWTLLRYRWWKPDDQWGFVDRWVRSLRTNEVLRHIKEGDHVLDIGCGSDRYFWSKAQRLGIDYVGIDAVLRGRESDGRASFIPLDLAAGAVLPFRDGEFTKVVALAVIEHVENPERLIKEAYRVLAPGGTLILTTPTAVAKPVLEGLAALRLVNRHDIEEHKRYFRKSDLSALASRSGFKQISHRYFEFGFNQVLECSKSLP